MLPTINLQLTDPAALSGDYGETSPLNGGAAQPEGSFADLLRAPVMVTAPAIDGQALPLTGNGLPAVELPEIESAGIRVELADAQEGEQLEVLAEDRAARPAAEEALPVLTPLSVEYRGRTVARSPVGGSTQFTAAAGDRLKPVADVLPDDIAAAIERVTNLKSAGAEPAQRAPFTLQQADQVTSSLTSSSSSSSSTVPPPVSSSQSPGVELLPVGGESGQNSLSSTSPLSSSSPVSNAAPLAAQPVFGPAPAAAATAPVFETTIGLPVQDPAWPDTLNERVVFMSGQKIQNAEIRLTPAELGPIRVNVAVEDGATHITFNAQHPATREAIEAALPRLREMLNEQGLSLDNASVADQGPNPDSDRGAADDVADSAGNYADPSTGDSRTARDADAVRIARGLVDTFA